MSHLLKQRVKDPSEVLHPHQRAVAEAKGQGEV
jgi:hypothetical protein